MTGLPPPNDASIRDESIVWRRIPPWHIIYDENLGRWRPSSSAFADDPDGQSMSVVLAEAVGGRGAAEILAGHEGFALAAVPVGVVRACGLGVVRDPLASRTGARSRRRSETQSGPAVSRQGGGLGGPAAPRLTAAKPEGRCSPRQMPPTAGVCIEPLGRRDVAERKIRVLAELDAEGLQRASESAGCTIGHWEPCQGRRSVTPP